MTPLHLPDSHAATTVAISLVSLLTGYALGRFLPYLFQNRGEAGLARAVTSRFTAPDYHLLNHLTLRVGDGTTQIDHVLVCRFGVFVIETKHFSGWIFGSPEDRYWTQSQLRGKYRFQNPIRQNYKHVCAVRELLDFLPPEVIQSVVVFTGEAQFKTPIPDGVFDLQAFIEYLATRTTEVLTPNRVQFSVGRLETTRLALTRKTDVEHAQRIRSRFGNLN